MPELELDYYFRDLDQETVSARLIRWAKTYWFCFPCFALPFVVAFLLSGGPRSHNIFDSLTSGLQFGGLGFACAVGLVLLWKLDEYIERTDAGLNRKKAPGDATAGEAQPEPVELEVGITTALTEPSSGATGTESEPSSQSAVTAVQAAPAVEASPPPQAAPAAAKPAEPAHKLEAVHILFGAMLWIVWMGSAVIMVLAQCEIDAGTQMFTQPF